MRQPRDSPGRTALRLGLQVAGIVSVLVLALTATAAAVVVHHQRTEAEVLLGEALRNADDVGDPPAGMYLTELTPGGAVHGTTGTPPSLLDAGPLRRTASTGAPEAFDVRIGERDFRVQTRRSGTATFQAALDLRANHAERDGLLTAMATAGAAGLLAAAGLGAWLGHRATRPLRTALALQRRFVADAGHELRTPLTLLSTRAQLLRRQLPAGPANEQTLLGLDRVVTDTHRLSEILDDLLLAADPTAAASRQAVDMVALVDDVAAGFLCARAALRFDTGGPGARPIIVSGSATALRRAVVALVDNAQRHASTAVEVSLRSAGRQVVLEVADDGPGVPPDVRGRLFHRFASTAATDADGRRHYGIGLALVGDIVAAHDGTVALVASDRPGSIFRLTLPGARSS